MSALRLTILLLASASLAACATPRPTRFTETPPPKSTPQPAKPGASARGTMKPYQIRGVWYYPAEQPDYDEVGLASWYGEQFHNRYTAVGEVFDMDRLSAAHKTLPLPSIVEVKNLDNGRTLRVRVNDRGPFVDGRIIDLSRAAAEELGFKSQGVAKVRVRYVGPAGRPDSFQPPQRHAAAPPPVTVAPSPASAESYKVQAAAFSSRDNAERAVRALADSGAAIEEMERDGAVLYRVVLGPAAGVAAAEALRDRAAASGFADAKIVRIF